jgi:SET domain-containing protein
VTDWTSHQPNALVSVKRTQGKGRGVFALQDIPPDTIIEYAPVVAIPPSQDDVLKQTVLDDYLFYWQPDTTKPAQQGLVFGVASFINHHHTPNCRVDYDYPHCHIIITSTHLIHKNQEMTIDYDCTLWFPYQED